MIPVAQTRTHGGWDLTLLALEDYVDGFVLSGQLVVEESPMATGFAHPELALDVRDDVGTKYDGRMHRASGGGSRPVTWRFNYRFTPVLAPAARELRVSVPEIRWRGFDAATQEPLPERTEPGPWRFVIPLAPAELPSGSG